jgi:2-isopropylmalate synthase
VKPLEINGLLAELGVGADAEHIAVNASSDLLFDWSHPGTEVRASLQDETLRDGLQAAYVRHPSLQEKQELLYLMGQIGIEGADIGFPASGDRQFDDVVNLATFAARNHLKIGLSCAGRTVESDILAIVSAAEIAGEVLEADLFIGSSEIRRVIQQWDLAEMQRAVADMVAFGVRHGLPVMLVTEDTTRAHPETLKALYRSAIESGATRICAADTVGAANPTTVMRLLTFLRREVICGESVRLDWHGHRDRGLDVANSLTAVYAGAERIHGSALGVGERSGNTPMEQLLVNFQLEHMSDYQLTALSDYVSRASEVLDVPIPINAPIVGQDAFVTASGVHADAIWKANEERRPDLAALVYAPFDPALVGRAVDVRVGPLSGKANVRLALNNLGLPYDDATASALLSHVKGGSRVLSQPELRALYEAAQAAVLQLKPVQGVPATSLPSSA